MEMTTFTENDKLCIKLSGEIDHHGAREVRTRLDELIMETRPRTLVINLCGINFMDSSGLGLLLGRYRVIKSLGGEMYLAEPTTRVRQILAMAGVDKMIKIL